MANIFKIDFYPHRWLVDTSQLPPEHRGNYIQIIMLIYAKEKPIDNDPKWIAGSCGCSSRLVTASIAFLVERGFLSLIENDSKITQKRSEHELNVRRTYLEQYANAARTTNEKMAEKKKNKDLENADRPENGNASNSNPNPISKEEKKESKSTVSSKKGSRFALTDLPDEWKLFCIQSRPDLKPEELFAEFRDYWIGVAGQRGLKLDWFATWRNRVREKKGARLQQTFLSFDEQKKLKTDQALEEVRKRYEQSE